MNRTQFEKAYQLSVEADMKNLKAIGELQYNFEQMSSRVANQR